VAVVAKKMVCSGRLRPDAPAVEERTELEIGYHILRREGPWYATEAARLVADYAFSTLEAPRVV